MTAAHAVQEPAGARLAPVIDVEPYLGPVRRERCACGGEIYASVTAPADRIAQRVAAHNATPAHAAWRARMEA